MTQIILDGVYLPKTSRDRYRCYEDLLSVRLEMVSGRMIQETRGKVWKVSYSYDYLGDELCRQVLAVLRSGKSFPASVLPDNSDSMIASTFLVESLTPPTFAFSSEGRACWHNLSFSMREVKPHG